MFEQRSTDDLAALDDHVLNDWAWMNNFPWIDDLPALEPGVRSYLAVALFEHEVQNGGLHQYFFNHPSPDMFEAVLEGYEFFGLREERQVIAQHVRPLSEHEREWRESLAGGSIEQFMQSYAATQLSEYNRLVPDSDQVRAAYVRANLSLFDN
jgi:Domain of unknown function (DUF4375)